MRLIRHTPGAGLEFFEGLWIAGVVFSIHDDGRSATRSTVHTARSNSKRISVWVSWERSHGSIPSTTISASSGTFADRHLVTRRRPEQCVLHAGRSHNHMASQFGCTLLIGSVKISVCMRPGLEVAR